MFPSLTLLSIAPSSTSTASQQSHKRFSLMSLLKKRHSRSWAEEETVIDSGDTENDEQFLTELDDERSFSNSHTVVTTQVVSVEVHEEYGVMLVCDVIMHMYSYNSNHVIIYSDLSIHCTSTRWNWGGNMCRRECGGSMYSHYKIKYTKLCIL